MAGIRSSYGASVYGIRPLINQHSHGRIGPCVWDKPGHRLHNERVAHDQADALRIAVYSGLRENGAVIEPHELHETDLAYAFMNQGLHFLLGCCGGHLCSEFAHVRPTDRRLDRRYHRVKRPV